MLIISQPSTYKQMLSLCEIISKMYLIENKEVTLLYKLNR